MAGAKASCQGGPIALIGRLGVANNAGTRRKIAQLSYSPQGSSPGFWFNKAAQFPPLRFLLGCRATIHNSQAVHALRPELSEDVNVAALAKAANMSRSAFFKHFKSATAVSPIQYQKRLRLLEARRLMIEEGETAKGSAFKVGYNSASQFSREYSRMFGNSPRRDAEKMSEDRAPGRIQF